MLPAGPMREGRGALKRADAVILTPSAPPEAASQISQPTFRMTVELTTLIESVGGEWHERPCGHLAGKRVVAVTGIANPQRVYELIDHWDAEIIDVFSFPDHHVYTREDWQRISRRSQDCDAIVTTEKDLVKLESFPFARGMMMALRIEPRVEGGERLIAMIEAKTVLRGVASVDGLGYALAREETGNADQ
jgi:tetraacyldisaccharide 4'-kinase